MVTLLAAIGPAVLWPGDTPWTNDEPMLIVHAAEANQGRWLVSRGLSGNLGLSYGPLPTQIYQALLLLTHDPCLLVALRGLLCAGVTAISLLSLARTLRFSPWFAAAVCLAPNVYLFHRILWDATFIVPIGTLAFAAYASFLQAGSRKSFLLMLATTFALPLIHPQTLPLFVVLFGHLLWRHRPAFWKHRFGVLAVAAVLLTLNARYLQYAIFTVVTQGSQLVRNGQGTKISPLRAALTPLFAGDILCGDPFSVGDSRLGHLASLVATARLLASAAPILVWAGIAISALRLIWSFRRSPARLGAMGKRTRLPVEPLVHPKEHGQASTLAHGTQSVNDPPPRAPLTQCRLPSSPLESPWTFGPLRKDEIGTPSPGTPGEGGGEGPERFAQALTLTLSRSTGRGDQRLSRQGYSFQISTGGGEKKDSPSSSKTIPARPCSA